MKKILVYLLTLALVLSALPALAADVTDRTIPYAEKTLATPEGYETLTAMAVGPDGNVIAVAKNQAEEWALITWTALDAAPTIVPIALSANDISALSVAPDGQILLLYTDMTGLMQSREAVGSQAQSQTGPIQIQEGGAPQSGNSNMGSASSQPGDIRAFGGNNITTSFLWLDASGNVTATFEAQGLLNQATALSGRRVAVGGSLQTGLTVYDETGAEIGNYGAGTVISLAAIQDTLYVLEEEALALVDLATGQASSRIPMQVGYSATLVAAPDGMLYILNAEAVFQVNPTTKEVSRIMALTGTLLGDPGNSASGFGVRGDGVLVALLSEGNGGMTGAGMRVSVFIGGEAQAKTLAYYTPMDPSLIGQREPFTITTLENSTRLRKAVSEFQRAHPELEVILQVQRGDNDETPLSDHIRTLNTDLLAGKGGDVLVLDGLPANKYAQRGILADLTSLLPALDLLPNLAEGSKSADGKTYAVSVQYSFQTLWGPKEQIDGIASLIEMAAGDDLAQAPLSARTAEDWLRLFYPSSESAFRDATGALHFNTPEFEAFLETLYSLYERQGELVELDMATRFAGAGRSVGRGGMNIREMMDVHNGVVTFYPSEIYGLMQLSTAYSLAGGTEGAVITLPAMDGTGRSYQPSLLVGINARSTKQQLAAEFLILLYSDEVQESDSVGGLPASQKTLDKQFADAIERGQEGAISMFSVAGGVSMTLSQPDEAAWNALKNLCETVDHAATIDETLMDFIISETAEFFEGRVSAAEAAQALEQRAWFYLNE